jgi:hypothetical protein
MHFLEVLEPAEILRFLHTFPQDIVNLLDFMSPQDIKESSHSLLCQPYQFPLP